MLAELRAGTVATLALTDALLSDATAHLVVRARRRLPEPVTSLVSFLEEELTALAAAAP